MNLSDHALKKPVTVFVIAIALLALGAVSLTRLKSEFLPKLDDGRVMVKLKMLCIQ